MPQTTLTVRVKALDEATPTLKKIQNSFKTGLSGAAFFGGRVRGAGGAGGGAGVPSSTGELGNAMFAGVVGGGVAGVVTALFSLMKDFVGKIIDIGKKLWSVMSEASGQLKAVNALWQQAILNVFRPMGDAIGMALLPATLALTSITADNYAKFLEKLQNGVDMQTALDENMQANIAALGTYFETVIDTMAPIIATGIAEWTPSMIDAVTQGLANYFSTLGDKGELTLDDVTNAGWKGLFGPIASWFVPEMPFSNYNPSTPVAGGGGIFNLNFNSPIYGVDDLTTTIQNAINSTVANLQGII